jgi:hypothetical protein
MTVRRPFPRAQLLEVVELPVEHVGLRGIGSYIRGKRLAELVG